MLHVFPTRKQITASCTMSDPLSQRKRNNRWNVCRLSMPSETVSVICNQQYEL